MLCFAISAETSGSLFTPAWELTALRIVRCPDNKVIWDAAYSRADGQSVNNPFNSITDEMVNGRPNFAEVTRKLEPFVFHKDKNGVFDTAFVCFNMDFYQKLFTKYGIYRNGLFVDMLTSVRDAMSGQAIVNMPSNAAGEKLPKINEVASFLGTDWPSDRKLVTPQMKTDLLCETFTYIVNHKINGRNNP